METKDQKTSLQSIGGRARAERLSPEERQEIARYAAESRWSGEGHAMLPRETHTGTLKIGEREIPCSVLDNGIRVFSARGLNRAMGSRKAGAARYGAPQLPYFLASPSLSPFISKDLMVRLISPLQYRPKHGGRTAFGYEAMLLPAVCEAILDADKAGSLRSSQAYLADMANVLLRGFARVGVIALVDEATGYQDERPRLELSKILEAYISAELMPWTKRFPDEFFRQLYRLQGWEYTPGSAKRTPYVGKLINKYIYGQLPPGVLDELRKKNPVTESGYRRHKHFQFLTSDTGNPHLDRQVTAVSTIMRISDDKYQFERNFDKAFPIKGIQQKLPLVIDLVERVAK